MLVHPGRQPLCLTNVKLIADGYFVDPLHQLVPFVIVVYPEFVKHKIKKALPMVATKPFWVGEYLDSTQATISVSNPCLVARPGIEPGTLGYEPNVLPVTPPHDAIYKKAPVKELLRLDG
jgi:hypothetical protein